MLIGDTVCDEEIVDLEGVVRHLCRRETKTSRLNQQRGFKLRMRVRENDVAHWTARGERTAATIRAATANAPRAAALGGPAAGPRGCGGLGLQTRDPTRTGTEVGRPMSVRTVASILCLAVGIFAAPLAPDAQQGGQVPSWDPAPRPVLVELQQTLAHAIDRFQAMDEAGVLSHVSDQYRSAPLTKAAIREQLRVMFTLYDTLRAQVRIDEAWTAGDRAWLYSTGEVSGRLRGLGAWTPILSWQHEPEVVRREQGVWRLYGYQQ